VEEEWKKQTQAVQRDLPRPGNINDTILRPQKFEGQLSDLHEVQSEYLCISIRITTQVANIQAEELIKKEMLILLHHDAVYNAQHFDKLAPGAKKSGKDTAAADEKKHLAYLAKNKYDEIDEQSLQQVCLSWCF